MAIKYLKLKQLLSLDLGDISHCKEALMSCDWDVPRAVDYVFSRGPPSPECVDVQPTGRATRQGLPSACYPWTTRSLKTCNREPSVSINTHLTNVMCPGIYLFFVLPMNSYSADVMTPCDIAAFTAVLGCVLCILNYYLFILTQNQSKLISLVNTTVTSLYYMYALHCLIY